MRNREKSGFCQKSEAQSAKDASAVVGFAPVDQIWDELTIMFLNSYFPSVFAMGLYFGPTFQRSILMDSDLNNRSQAIIERITLLRDSL
ncbi:MAG: hypothetical protein OSA89_08465 [Mariniblastus sp.]|nr:hypothetical protein [Mariniblastus sp.]|tara:strand:+ start:3253 stop:3519 length:267 start_codon:yes stop_codon:yes gene_type:complete